MNKQTQWSTSYKRRAYDQIIVYVPKPRKDDIKALASARNTTINGMVNEYFRKELGLSELQWKAK